MYDFVLFGNLLPKIAGSFGWSSSTSTAVNTWVTGGTAVVAFLIGPLVDRVGRKRGIVIAVIGAAVFSLLTAVVGFLLASVAVLGAVILIIVRSLAGLGYSEQAISATYLNEVYESAPGEQKGHNSGFIYSLVQSGWPVGSVLAAVSIDIIVPLSSWEWCFVVSVFPAIFMVIAARYLRESPAFIARREVQALVKAGQGEAAAAVASHTRGLSAGGEGSPFVDVFKGESRRPALVIGIAFLLNWFGVLTLDILGTSYLTAPDGKNINFTNSIAILAVANVTAFVGYLFFGWLGDKIGRRDAIGIGWLFCGLWFLILVVVIPAGHFVAAIIFFSLGLACLLGPYAALLFFNAESFPLSTRATGGSLINGAGQLGAVIAGILVTASLSAHWSWSTAAFSWGVLPIIASGILIWGAERTNTGTLRNKTPHDVPHYSAH